MANVIEKIQYLNGTFERQTNPGDNSAAMGWDNLNDIWRLCVIDALGADPSTSAAQINIDPSDDSFALPQVPGVSVSNLEIVTIDSSTGQLGSTPAGIWALPYTSVTTTPYVVLDTDCVLGVNTSSAKTIQLPDTPATGRYWVIKDVTGTAATNPITVTTVSGGGVTLIDNATSLSMVSNYQSINVLYNGSNNYIVW